MTTRSKRNPTSKQRNDLFRGLEVFDALQPKLDNQAGTSSDYVMLSDFDDRSEGWIMVSVNAVLDDHSIVVTIENYMVELSEVNKGLDLRHKRMILRDVDMFSACKGGMPKRVGTQIIIVRYKQSKDESFVASKAITTSVKDAMGRA